MKIIQRLSLACVASSLVWGGMILPPALAQTAPQQPPKQQTAPQKPLQDGPMSRDEVAERLNIVPVFTIVSKDGTPILANVDQEGKKVQVASFWLDQNQANSIIAQIKKSNPDIGAQAQVVPMSLGYAYQISESDKPKDVNILFQVLPRENDLKAALDIAKKTGQEVKQFPGVPLFYGVSEQGLLTVEREGVEVIPFFFDQTDLQTALQRVSDVNPDVIKKTRIEVTTLAQVVGSMLDGKAKSDVRKIAFVPAKASLEYVRNLPPSQQTGIDPTTRSVLGTGNNTLAIPSGSGSPAPKP